MNYNLFVLNMQKNQNTSHGDTLKPEINIMETVFKEGERLAHLPTEDYERELTKVMKKLNQTAKMGLTSETINLLVGISSGTIEMSDKVLLDALSNGSKDPQVIAYAKEDVAFMKQIAPGLFNPKVSNINVQAPNSLNPKMNIAPSKINSYSQIKQGVEKSNKEMVQQKKVQDVQAKYVDTKGNNTRQK